MKNINYSEVPSEAMILLWRMQKFGYCPVELKKLNRNLILQMRHPHRKSENIIYNYLDKETHTEQVSEPIFIKYLDSRDITILVTKPEGETLKETIKIAKDKSPKNADCFSIQYADTGELTYHDCKTGEMILD